MRRRVSVEVAGAVSVVAAFAVALAALVVVPDPAHAQALTCDADVQRAPARPVASPALASGLPAPFAYQPASVDRAAVLREVAAVVSRQASELGADACFVQKPAQIVERVDFLSPFEFLVVSLFQYDPGRRDALLDLYATDPQAAVGELGPVFPSPRAQAALTTYAFHDVNTRRIRVNAAQVRPEELRRVLVHEMWHAMPRLRVWTEAGSAPTRASGFWLQEQRAGSPFWMPVDERRGLPYPPYLLDEAMATLMETRYAGPSRFARPDLDDAQFYLDRLMAAAGAGEVMSRYLDSRPMDLIALIDTHRASLPEPGIFAGR